MTKEKAIELARAYGEERGPILDVKEYDDIFVVTFAKAWETYIVNRETEEVHHEQELTEEESLAIAKRPYTITR